MVWFGRSLCALMGAGLLGAVMPLSAAADETVDILRWNRAPIAVHLPVGQERYIWFPGRVQPGIPPDLVSKLRVQAVNDTIYLKASAPFETTRLPVRDLSHGDFYLLDLSTSEEAPATPLRVVKAAGGDEDAFVGKANDESDEASERGDGYVKLTRFAAQQSYAPKRLVRQEPGIHNVPLPSAGDPVEGLLRSMPIEAVPAGSWRGRGGLYVTAVTLRNLSDTALSLDPRRLAGQWLTATFHHQGLAPASEAGDGSTLYLISDRPFSEALAP